MISPPHSEFEFINIDAYSVKNAIDTKKAGVGIARKISVDILLKYMNLETIKSKFLDSIPECGIVGCFVWATKLNDKTDKLPN